MGLAWLKWSVHRMLDVPADAVLVPENRHYPVGVGAKAVPVWGDLETINAPRRLLDIDDDRIVSAIDPVLVDQDVSHVG